VPSISLKRFIQRALDEDDFFAFALENPLGAMKECGARLQASSFIPADFAAFFGALAALKESMKNKDREPLSFEAIFGQGVEIRGASLRLETQRGFFKEWDNRDAFSETQKCFSASQSFEADRERSASSAKELCQSQEVRIQTLTVGETSKSSETFRSQTREWDNADAVQTRRTDQTSRANFEKDGSRTLEELLSGPLIHPEDLAAISARIDTYTRIG
jgi:hypothetical protein